MNEQTREIFEKTNRIYGCRRLQKALSEEGIDLSEWKVRRIMRENGLYPETLKKYRPGKQEKPDGRYCENAIRQDFSCEYPNQKWVGDITYLKTGSGWIYLAAVMDLYNREVVGYSVSRTIDTELACRALGNALHWKKKNDALIFHSDRGSQYCNKRYQAMLAENKIRGSMSKAGCPYDNSCMESFLRA